MNNICNLVVACCFCLTFNSQSAFAVPFLQESGIIVTSPFDQSSISMTDTEGSAIVTPDGSLWLVDDESGILFEVDAATGLLIRSVDTTSLLTSLEFGGSSGPLASQLGDMEALAYDSINDYLYVFNGTCCASSPNVPTIFRLTRQGGILAPESYQTLAEMRDFSGAAANSSTGELWAGEGRFIYPVDYETNTVGLGVELDVQGRIYGLGFSVDGTALFAVTSANKLYKFMTSDWSVVTDFDLTIPNAIDSRSVVDFNNLLYIGDGYGDFPNGDPLSFAVHKFTVEEGIPPNSTVTDPADGMAVLSPVVVQGFADDDLGVVSMQFRVRDRDLVSGPYLQPDGSFGSSYWFEQPVDLPGSSI